ncbi:UNVERIFIED_CONTAM: hypothetical protein BEN50_18230 [Euhalothece sp. KZN 001]
MCRLYDCLLFGNRSKARPLFEPYSYNPNIATFRYSIKILGKAEAYRQQLQEKQSFGYKVLKILENYLQHHSFLVAEQDTIADIYPCYN